VGRLSKASAMTTGRELGEFQVLMKTSHEGTVSFFQVISIFDFSLFIAGTQEMHMEGFLRGNLFPDRWPRTCQKCFVACILYRSFVYFGHNILNNKRMDCGVTEKEPQKGTKLQ
jgi:hypothetical protein